jgi:hypothetical protein
MGIQRSQEDAWTKEMAKWEHRPVLVNGTYVEPIPFAEGGKGGAPGTEFPKMLYRADSYEGGPRIAEHTIVHDEGQERVAKGQGWCVKQEDAIAGVYARQRELAELAANRAHNDRWMSDKARAEAQAVDETTMAHVAAIPETPIRRTPGRPRATQTPSA